MRKRLTLLVAAVVMALSMALSGVAFGAITPANCTNGGGNQPGGQQPTCTGGGLTQNPATNPAGQAPPGQQP
jgi:hypothetical protein